MNIVIDRTQSSNAGPACCGLMLVPIENSWFPLRIQMHMITFSGRRLKHGRTRNTRPLPSHRKTADFRVVSQSARFQSHGNLGNLHPSIPILQLTSNRQLVSSAFIKQYSHNEIRILGDAAPQMNKQQKLHGMLSNNHKDSAPRQPQRQHTPACKQAAATTACLRGSMDLMHDVFVFEGLHQAGQGKAHTITIQMQPRQQAQYNHQVNSRPSTKRT